MNQGRLFLDPCQSPSLGEQVVVDVEGGFHMYEYGRTIHIPQETFGCHASCAFSSSHTRPQRRAGRAFKKTVTGAQFTLSPVILSRGLTISMRSGVTAYTAAPRSRLG